jgi:Ni,Fe-hydrogenase I small subunit
MEDISPFKALDFIRDNAPEYAQSKANVVYMTEYRKTIKASLMAASREKTESAKETYAYAHPEYKAHLLALEQAVAKAEKLRWLMVAAEAKIEVWKSLEASARAEGRATT